MKFKSGDKVTVTNPEQPTHHTGGETGTVTGVVTVGGSEIVQLVEDQTGQQVGVHPDEISKR
ncbi:hypothetical protein [Streptomyces candidus]|uniref:DUF1918 domain-containing protein n=1 Tax=Streptomyces candidus TaxID=67283 RepID=A0A7X0HM60_9ACTN|nr:hypothetical protein [Streptomyces candidus]MBB6440096.1 hypothetical protein [Streptomyces candidus]GHH58245.1 hypothetical protein GCM10018773_66360 [Streptomyces candidus]